VRTKDLVELHPHGATCSGIEAMLRDVVGALDGALAGPTPGAYLTELWGALGTLRRALTPEGVWRAAQAGAWAVLLDAAEGASAPPYPGAS
jgi:hypothetical protein